VPGRIAGQSQFFLSVASFPSSSFRCGGCHFAFHLSRKYYEKLSDFPSGLHVKPSLGRGSLTVLQTVAGTQWDLPVLAFLDFSTTCSGYSDSRRLPLGTWPFREPSRCCLSPCSGTKSAPREKRDFGANTCRASPVRPPQHDGWFTASRTSRRKSRSPMATRSS